MGDHPQRSRLRHDQQARRRLDRVRPGDGYQPPRWPDETAAKRYHLDLYVDDLTVAEKEFVAAGATKPEFQPGDGRWVVLLDPVGQPFCICPRPQG
nr:VOC family protein [Micromonospora sp. 4G55]